MDSVLSKLHGKMNRKAQFRTVIALIDENGKEHLFEGICNGEILEKKVVKCGFGYDPIFQPESYQ